MEKIDFSLKVKEGSSESATLGDSDDKVNLGLDGQSPDLMTLI